MIYFRSYNKFVVSAIAFNAAYPVTEDSHFKELKQIPFERFRFEKLFPIIASQEKKLKLKDCRNL